MPTDSLLVAVCVVAMFVVFAAVLFWGDLQTRPKQLADSSARQAPRLLIGPSPRGGPSAGRARLTEDLQATPGDALSALLSRRPISLDSRQYVGRLSALWLRVLL